MIHTFNDGSHLVRMNVRELITLPVWKGNRILDVVHANKISAAIGGNIKSLDSAVYRVIKYMELSTTNTLVEQKYLIDGQHRAHVLRKYYDENLCVPDFDVLVMEKSVDSETDAIEYFNALNNVKPQHWNHDPALLTNKYIAAIEARFNIDKRNPLIRQKGTKRPFLSVDKLRETLGANVDKLRQTTGDVKKFVDAVVLWNTAELKKIQLRLLNPSEKDSGVIENCLEKKFALALDMRLPWVRVCLG